MQKLLKCAAKINLTKSSRHHHNFGADNKMFEETTRRRMIFSGYFCTNYCQVSRKVILLKPSHGTEPLTFAGNQTYLIFVNEPLTFAGNQTYLIFVNDSQIKEQYYHFFHEKHMDQGIQEWTK